MRLNFYVLYQDDFGITPILTIKQFVTKACHTQTCYLINTCPKLQHLQDQKFLTSLKNFKHVMKERL